MQQLIITLKLQDLNLLFKIPVGRRKDFLEILDNLGTRH